MTSCRPADVAGLVTEHHIRSALISESERTVAHRAGAPQRLHLLTGALLGNPAMYQVGDVVAFCQLLVAAQLTVRRPYEDVLRPHRVVLPVRT